MTNTIWKWACVRQLTFFIDEDISTMERTFSLLIQQINVMCFNKVLLFCYSISSTVPDKKLWQRIAGEDEWRRWLFQNMTYQKSFYKWCWRWWQFLCNAHQRFLYVVWRKLNNICLPKLLRRCKANLHSFFCSYQ